MTEYLVLFNDEWVPDLTEEDLREASRRVRAVRAEMMAAKVLVFTGGLDEAALLASPVPLGWRLPSSSPRYTSHSLANPASGGSDVIAVAPISMRRPVRGIRASSPPWRSTSRVPVACRRLPAPRKSGSSAWLQRGAARRSA
jgi:hypothetical protein